METLVFPAGNHSGTRWTGIVLEDSRTIFLYKVYFSVASTHHECLHFWEAGSRWERLRWPRARVGNRTVLLAGKRFCTYFSHFETCERLGRDPLIYPQKDRWRMKGRECYGGKWIRLLRNQLLDRTWQASLDYDVRFDSERSGVSPWLAPKSGCVTGAPCFAASLQKPPNSASRILPSILLLPLPESLLLGRGFHPPLR